MSCFSIQKLKSKIKFLELLASIPEATASAPIVSGSLHSLYSALAILIQNLFQLQLKRCDDTSQLSFDLVMWYTK